MAIREEAYVYGNTVRQPRVSIDRQTALQPSEPKRVSKQVHKNRKRALDMNKGYVLFLSVAAIAALFICVRYLQIQSEITNRSEAIAALQSELTELKRGEYGNVQCCYRQRGLRRASETCCRRSGNGTGIVGSDHRI